MNPDDPRPACAGKWRLFDSFEPDDQKAAQAICATCPLIAQCRGWLNAAKLATPASHPGPGGTWAGIPMKQASEVCGTPGGRARHRRLDEPPCDACSAAHAAARREQRRRKRDQQGRLTRDPFPQQCGTERGYQWHRNNDRDNWPLPADDPCGCRAAHAAWWMSNKREKEAAA